MMERLTKMIVFLIVLWGVYAVFHISGSSESPPPCVKYETKLIFDPATKASRPARFCVQEGTWVQG
jgi:hypothetical protein